MPCDPAGMITDQKRSSQSSVLRPGDSAEERGLLLLIAKVALVQSPIEQSPWTRMGMPSNSGPSELVAA